jgi:RNA-binding protein YlmH
MDRRAILSYYADYVDSEGIFLGALERLEEAERYYEPQITAFMTPDLVAVFEKIADSVDITVLQFGAFASAERVRLCFVPYASEPPKQEDYVALLEIQYREKFGSIGHRDVLGALLSLGIQRKKIGDITFDGARIQFAADAAIADYLASELSRVGRMGVTVRRRALSDAIERNETRVEAQVSVQSLRLDAVLAAGFNLSRQTAQDLIEADKVKLNHRQELHVSKDVNPGDVISVRGYGRLIVSEILGESKKGRIRLMTERYVQSGSGR